MKEPNFEYIHMDYDDIENTMRSLINARDLIDSTMKSIPEKDYTEQINNLFRTIHSLKASISYYDLDEISSVIEKSEDIMSFLRNNECTIGNDVKNWFLNMSNQFNVWINEFQIALEEYEVAEFNNSSFYSNELDIPPIVKVANFKFDKISSHRIIILMSDKSLMYELERELGKRFKLISSSSSVSDIINILKNIKENKILISDIKLKDGNITQIVNQNLINSDELLVYTKVTSNNIEKFKSILKVDNMYSSDEIYPPKMVSIIETMVRPDGKDSVIIPLTSTKISLADLTQSLKPIPEILTRIGDACFDENVHFKDLAYLIEQDATITAKLLRHINSPYYGLHTKISTINQAITLLGKNRVYAVAMAGMTDDLIPNIDVSMYDIDINDVISINKLRSRVLEDWCKELAIPIKTIEVVNTISIVMVLGTYLAAKALSANLQYSKFKTLKNSDELYIIEKKLLDYSSFDIVSKLFTAWHFPEMFIWVSKMMPLYDLKPNQKSSISEYAFIISIIHKIIRIDGILSLNTDTLLLVEKSGLSANKLKIAWSRTFGKDSTGYFKDFI